MELNNHLHTSDGWDVYENQFDPSQIVTTGSNFMVGNGYLGYRGTLAEWEADRYVACVVTDTWDTAPDGRWSELCNVPNGLYLKITVNGTPLGVDTGEMRAYQRRLDMQRALFSREMTWRAPDGAEITLRNERFASYDKVRLLMMRVELQATTDAEIIIDSGIDGRVWSLNGDHFKTMTGFQEGNLIGLDMRTHERDTQIVVLEATRLASSPADVTIEHDERRIMRRMSVQLQAGESVTLEKVVLIAHSNDFDNPRAWALDEMQRVLESGYESQREAHIKAWAQVWQHSDIEIDGDLEAQTLTRFNLYQNIIATPKHARLPIGARGLSCQVYQGAAFWDQEIFNLPMFIYTEPDLARNILAYRYDTLNGARRKAQRLGYYGAYYAWTSGKTGDELFPDWFFKDVLSGRPIRNHFNSWQIHISPDIVYALWHYVEATGDWAFVVDYGAEIAFEVAQFAVSRLHFKKDKNRYEIIRVLGPDEYHENVDNNAFTNYQFRYALAKALVIYEHLQREHPDRLAALFERLGLSDRDVDNWRDIVNLIYLPQPDPATHLIEQFDGYFELEDTTPEQVRERLIDPTEYWGWPNGVAVHTQVNKQADVVQLLALHRSSFSPDVIRANFDYYEPRTEHGSSLSPSVHAQVATFASEDERAYAFFLKSATIDLYNASKKVTSGGTFLGGIHTAAAGAIWQMIVQGFAGFEHQDGVARFQPRLPQHWEAVRFHLVLHGNRLHVNLCHDAVRLEADPANAAQMAVQVGDTRRVLQPGESTEISFA